MGSAERSELVSGLITLGDGSRPKVLMAEDSAAARYLTAALLTRMGCDVDAVEHGEEALDMVRASLFDLILLDIEMPVMDGVAAAREIRALGGDTGRTPILALSAFLADVGKREDWRGAFDAMLAKPAGREQLRKAVLSLLRCQTPPAQPARPSNDPAAVLDREALETVRARIEGTQWNILVDLAIAEMRDVAQAMRTAPGRDDVRHGSHKLKGIASTFAATRLATLAAGLETAVCDLPATEMTRRIAGVADCVEETAAAMSAAA
jgi:CheY-like chemotaxis protein